VVLWTLADRWEVGFRPSGRTIMEHLGGASVLAAAHLTLLQHTLWALSWFWPAWGRGDGRLDVQTLERFGVELAIYGFTGGVCAFLHSQMQTQQKLEIERQLTQAQLKALQMQMEPHFLFNTLNAITTLVRTARQKEADATLTHLNTILKATLSSSTPEKIPLSQELQTVDHYLAIEQTRFADRLRVEMKVDPTALDGLVPCFLLQPIVENAIRHGIAQRERDGLIQASVARNGAELRLNVRDNGPGMNAKSASGHGIGLKNTKQRLTHFYQDRYDLTVSEPPGGGYEVSITIPYERARA
jgi:sensor histidine kinase YesM